MSMVDDLKSYFDFNKDGDTDLGDVGYLFKKFLAFVMPIIVTAAKKGISDILIPAARSAVIAVATQSGDKKDAALSAIVENMEAQGIQLGMDSGMSAIDAIASHFNIDKSEVNLILEREVAAAKMSGDID